MADIKISELTQAESLSLSDLMESAVPYNGGFLSRRMSIAQLANYLENYVQHTALSTTAKSIIGAINEIVGDLDDYYTKQETYSKSEVDTLIAGVSGLHFEVVQQLPTSDIDMNTIYLVPKQDSGQQDVYDEFICLDNTTTPATWEKIGTTEIDLSDYVTDTELTTILNDYVTSSGLSTILASYATTSAMTTALADKVDKVSGKGLSTEDYTTAEKTKVNGLATVATSGSYNDLTEKPTIPDELADLADDINHRVVTDTEKATWNGKAELTDVDKAELNTWNLLRQPYFHGSGTSSGTTRTVNADGSVTFTGTATASFYFNFKRYTQEWKLPKGTYRVSGCPSGGSSSSYFLRVSRYTTSAITLVDEYGDGAEFTLTEESVMQINGAIINGYAIQGSLTFKPFIVPKEKVDEKVKQTAISSSSNANYRILLSKSASDAEETDTVQKNSSLYYNPYDGELYSSKISAASGNFYGLKVTELQTAQYYFQNGSSQVVAMLEANSASTASNPTFVTLPASSGTLALQSDITSAINDLDVASTSIGQGETLATIKEENGKIAVTKQNIKIGLGQVDNFYRIGTNNAISGSTTWHKVASVTAVPGTNEDDIILLSVMDTYLPDTDDNISDAGILYCRVRQGTSGSVDSVNYAELKFVANSGLNPSNFRLYHKTDTNGITFEIWTSMNRRYAWRKFSVISQGDRTSVYSNAWTLYNSTSPSAAPTESATYVRVECKDNTYKQTENNILGAKNLIKYPYSGGSYLSKNNVEISVYEDGSIYAQGSNPGTGNGFGYTIRSRNETIVLDPTQSYIVSGMSNGSASTIRLLLDLWTDTQDPTTETYTTRLYQATTPTTIPTGYKYLQITMWFYASAGNILPLTVKPMLRLASIADNTFEPYADSNRNLSINKADYAQIATVENGPFASRAYTYNELMIWNGKLYRVLNSIGSGGSIASKVTETTLSAEIKEIRDALNI